MRATLSCQTGLDHDPLLQELSAIGQLCMEQLTKLRHRGAFSTVAQTFAICCQQAIEVQGQQLHGLRYQWYQVITRSFLRERYH